MRDKSHMYSQRHKGVPSLSRFQKNLTLNQNELYRHECVRRTRVGHSEQQIMAQTDFSEPYYF